MTLSNEQTAATGPRQCCQGGICAVANSCNTTFNTAGFIFSSSVNGAVATIPTHIASKPSGTYYLRGIRTNTTTKACESALSGANTVDMAYECNNPTTCTGSNLMSVNGGAATTIQRNDNGAALSYTSVNMTFDVDGNAPFTFNYSDAGQVKLHARKTVNSATLLGSTNAFVVRPFGFRITDPPSGRTGATSTVFTSAGTNFNTTLTAVVWEAADDVDNDGVPDSQGVLSGNVATPNFGRETVAATATLSHALVEPALSPNTGSLSGSPSFSGFTNGTKTQSVAYSEVGIIRLLATTSNYLGSGENVTAGPSTGGLTGVGRFIPHHFVVTPMIHGCTGAGFTYSGQPFAQVRVQARNLADVNTSNYHNFGGGLVFSKDTTISNAGVTTNFSNNVIAGTVFANGIGTQTTVTYTFPPNPMPAGKETVPATLTLRAIDMDSVSSSGYTEDSAEIRSGRVYIMNAYGSELADLPVPMRVEFYSADGWVTNGADTCSSTALNVLSNFQGNLNSGETCVQDTGNPGVSGQGCAVAGLIGDRYTSPPSAGSYNLNLKAPGPGNDGSVDVSANLGTKIWLRHDWDDDGTRDDPSGRATFGLFRGSPRHIYQRERY